MDIFLNDLESFKLCLKCILFRVFDRLKIKKSWRFLTIFISILFIIIAAKLLLSVELHSIRMKRMSGHVQKRYAWTKIAVLFFFQEHFLRTSSKIGGYSRIFRWILITHKGYDSEYLFSNFIADVNILSVKHSDQLR